MPRIAVGYVARAHGIRGELRVHLHAPGSTALDDATTVFIDGVSFAIDAARSAGEAWLLTLGGVRDRNQAEALAGKVLEVERDQLDLADDEFLVADLVGCACEDPEGAPLGIVHAVQHGPQDLLVLRDPARKLERLVPLVPELVTAVDIEARRVVLDLPEGLPEESVLMPLQIEIVTILPELFTSFLAAGMLGKAVGTGALEVRFTNPRDFAENRYKSVDDAPYGGGVGMVMSAPPLLRAIAAATSERGPAHRVLLTPVGKKLDDARVRALATLPRLLLLCGRYEGIDERVSALAIDEELSLGDFVLTGGEPAAMTLIDAICRHLPGVLGDATSADDESFAKGLLEYPQYTRPPTVEGLAVPEVLLSGNHDKIQKWREASARERTAARRPDLLPPPPSDLHRRTHVVLMHHPVYNRNHEVVTTAVTNLDIHDIARSSRTYGLAGYTLVTPITVQRELVQRILGHWQGDPSDPTIKGKHTHETRADALSGVEVVSDLDEVIASVTRRHGLAPRLVATAAAGERKTIAFPALRADHALDPRPLVLIFGTGWGLTDTVFTKVNDTLEPISGPVPYNHLSVRSAVAIVCDRLFGTTASR